MTWSCTAWAAMAGKTNAVVGFWNNYFTHVPVGLAIHEAPFLGSRVEDARGGSGLLGRRHLREILPRRGPAALSAFGPASGCLACDRMRI